MILTLLAGAGWSLSSGLNAYLPLLILALTDRIGNSFNLESPFSWISTNVGILVLLFVLPLELVGDKIPRIDRVNDLAHTALRPLAGGFCFMAVASEAGDLNIWFAAALGVAIAGATHLWKMRSRVAITRGTAGLGNPFASTLEDGVAIAVAIASAAAPIANVMAIPVGIGLLHRSYVRIASGKNRLVRAFQPRS